MASLLLRNLDEALLKRLKSAAAENGRSLQAEIHEILRQANTCSLAQTRRLSARWLKRLQSSRQSDSVELIRQDRDRK